MLTLKEKPKFSEVTDNFMKNVDFRGVPPKLKIKYTCRAMRGNSKPNLITIHHSYQS